MSETNATRELFRSMLLDEKQLLPEVLDKARRVFLLDSRSNLVFQIPKKRLNNKQLIGMYLLGVYIASKLDEIDINSPEATAEDLATMSGIDQKIVRARLSDLKKQLIADSPERGLYQITIPGARTLLDEILEDYEGE